MHTYRHLIITVHRCVGIITPRITVIMHLHIYRRIYRIGESQYKFAKIHNTDYIGGNKPLYQLIFGSDFRKINILRESQRITLRQSYHNTGISCPVGSSVC